MSERLDVMSLTQMVDRPPVTSYVDGHGGLVQEESVLVGVIDAPPDRRQYLTDLGIDLTYAEYDQDNQRWERCLFSEGVADLLEDLHAEGDFPYSFEAGPSQGELEWVEAKARGATERPELPAWKYAVPASAEALDVLATGSGQKKDRRSTPGSD